MILGHVQLTIGYTEPQQEIFFGCDPSHRFIIVPKGRRFGATQGAIQFLIEEAIDGKANLWGDTINSNIDRYFERYGKPILVKNKIPFNFSSQQKKLTFPFSDGFIDFRSADRPENWEGFGYHNIVLNEAGIILKNDYLYTNAVLPMLMDHSNSRLFAMGVPKGKTKRNGTEHKFYTLYRNAKAGRKGYRLLAYTSYDNPTLSHDDIKELEDEIAGMNPIMVKQEIYAQFVDEVDGSLWTPELIRHAESIPEIKRVVVAIDPSATKGGDQTGIVCAGISHDGKLYVLSDRSGSYTPGQWGQIAANELAHNDGDLYVIETNQGGDMAENIIRQYDKINRVKRIHATKGKQLRAEPVVSMYERDMVRHAHGLHALENEMMTWVPGQGASPNRVDALVYALLELAAGDSIKRTIIPSVTTRHRM